MDAIAVINEVNARFTSGNSGPVERAMIRREEWETIVSEVEGLIHDLERSMANHVADLNDRPAYAIDPMNPHVDGGRCPKCGTYWEVVRPGKWQPRCECSC